ncbi:MAG: hypothetical protein IPJ41_04150 [Phycisphaerales bacterium]|nr:hypothetical protein [Phycisphaerales bacterium]
MSIPAAVIRALCLGAAVAMLVGAPIGCVGSSGGSASGLDAPGARLQEARQAAQQAAATAAKAARARERKRTDEAAKLTSQAVEQYRDALNISGDMPEAWNNLGALLVVQGDLMPAADAFTIAMQQSPTDPRPCENLGLVYNRAGWAEESLKYYDLALDRSANYLPALRGSIQQASLLGLADETRLANVRRALMLEQDDRWRDLFDREQLRITGRMETDKRGVGQR